MLGILLDLTLNLVVLSHSHSIPHAQRCHSVLNLSSYSQAFNHLPLPRMSHAQFSRQRGWAVLGSALQVSYSFPVVYSGPKIFRSSPTI